MKVKVTLSEQELRTAATGGIERRIAAIQMGLKSKTIGRPDHLQKWWQSDITGAIGEYAVCKAFGVEWLPTIGKTDQKDCLDYQVRTIEDPNGGLKVRTHDNPADLFILAQVHKNKVLLHGWLPGHRVLAYQLEIYPNCFTVPNTLLYSMADLNQPIEFGPEVQHYYTPRQAQSA